MKTKLAIAFTALIAFTTLATAQGASVQLEGVLLTNDPQPIQSGEDAEISFKITNMGDTEAENVRVQIVDSYPFQLKPDRKRNYSLGQLNPGQEYYITSEVLVAENAPDGQNDFKIRISHGDRSSIEEIPVNVQSEDIELNLANLKTSPSQLMPDTDGNTMTVEVVNNGEKTAENVVLQLDLPEVFERTSSFSTRQALGNIQSGEIKAAEFRFDISENASKGELDIPATLTYTAGDNTAEITEETSFSTYLSGRPRFEIESIESELIAGQRGEIRMQIRNTGSEKSGSTRVRILDNSDLPFSFGSSNKFLGTLNPGSTGTVVFDVNVESDADIKDYLMDFEIRGVKDSDVFVEEKVQSVEVNDSGEEEGTPILPILIVLAVAGAALYFFRSKLPF